MKARLLGATVSGRVYRQRMVYPGTFYRLVIIGRMYGDPFNMTLSFVPTEGSEVPPLPAGFLDLLEPAIRVPLSSASSVALGLGLVQDAIFTSFKLNRIGPDGRYVDATTNERVWSPVITGSGPTGRPAQDAIACTIRGLNERERAGRGRMYLPMGTLTATLDGTGRISIANASSLAEKFHSFLQGMDGVFIDASVPALSGIASKQGAGAFQVMHTVSVGRVVDTIRSRRSAIDEDPQYFPFEP